MHTALSSNVDWNPLFRSWTLLYIGFIVMLTYVDMVLVSGTPEDGWIQPKHVVKGYCKTHEICCM
jgi:hypothetical protein